MNYFYTLIFLVVTFVSQAQLPGWNYTKTIQVQENSGINLTHYQLELSINTATLVSNGSMSPLGDDIRFSSSCSGGTLFPYWIESGMNTATTKIWVKIDTLQANASKNIYMHYGNNSALATSAVEGTFNGPHSSTDSVATGTAGGVSNSQRGFRFSPNETLLVTSFGKREPSGTTRIVTLFDFNTQAIVTQTQVNGPAAQYSYNALANPIWLQQGTQYLLQLYQGAGDGYYFGSSSQIGQHLTYYDMRYCNSCTENTFPTNFLNNYHYGYPDLWYFTKNTATVAPSYAVVDMSVSLADFSSVCLGDTLTLSPSVSNATGSLQYSWTNVSIDNPTVSTPQVFPSMNMYYYLTVSDNCGNVAQDSIMVNVNQLPVFQISANTSSICYGSSATLVASGVYDFLWSTGINNDSIIVLPLENQSYSVTATDGNNCSSTEQIMIMVNPLPSVNAGSDQMICAGTTITLNGSGATTYSWDNDVNDGVTFSPAASATYTVTGTDANGCTNSDEVFVTVYALPTVNAGADQSVCTGSTVTLSASGALTYAWDNNVTNDIAFTPIATTTYSVSGTDGNGCSSTDTVIVAVNSLPNVNAGTDQTLCNGDAVTLTGTGASTYSWDNNVSDGVAFNPTATATYSVSGTDANGCTNADQVTVTVNEASASTLTESAVDSYTLNGQTYTQSGTYTQVIPNAAGCDSTITLNLTLSFTGITEIGETNIIVYPNPTNDELNILLPTESAVNYILIDSRGRKVREGSLQGTENQISLKGFTPGAYFLKIGQDEVPIRVIKQ